MSPAWIAPTMLAAGVACFVAAAFCKPARAAEQTRWHIVLSEKPTAAEPDQRRVFVISEAYTSRDLCLLNLRRVRIMAKDAKALCLPTEDNQ